MFISLTAFLFSFFSIPIFNVFARCGNHAPSLNLFNLTLKNMGMFSVNLFCHLHSFFGCFYPIVDFFVLRKHKQNELPNTTTTTTITTIVHVVMENVRLVREAKRFD